MPTAAARLRTLQWVAFGGFSCSVMCTTCLIFSGVSGLTRDGRVASFNPPPPPLARSRRRQRRTVSRLLPTAAAIASAVNPSLASNTIRALQTTFCGVFRSRTSRSNRSRSTALTAIRSIFLAQTRRFAPICESCVSNGTLAFRQRDRYQLDLAAGRADRNRLFVAVGRDGDVGGERLTLGDGID